MWEGEDARVNESARETYATGQLKRVEKPEQRRARVPGAHVSADGVHVQSLELGERTRHAEELDDGFVLCFYHEAPFARLDGVDDHGYALLCSSEKRLEFFRSSFECVSALASLLLVYRGMKVDGRRVRAVRVRECVRDVVSCRCCFGECL